MVDGWIGFSYCADGAAASRFDRFSSMLVWAGSSVWQLVLLHGAAGVYSCGGWRIGLGMVAVFLRCGSLTCRVASAYSIDKLIVLLYQLSATKQISSLQIVTPNKHLILSQEILAISYFSITHCHSLRILRSGLPIADKLKICAKTLLCFEIWTPDTSLIQ